MKFIYFSSRVNICLYPRRHECRAKYQIKCNGLKGGHVPNSPEFGTCPRFSIVCPKCGGQMKVIAFVPDFQAVDRIIDHLKLAFVAEKPPPSRVFGQVALIAAAEGRAEYLSDL